MAKQKFPTEIFVCTEQEGTKDEYLNAQEKVIDFDFDGEVDGKRTVAVYRFQKVVVAERMISVRG